MAAAIAGAQLDGTFVRAVSEAGADEGYESFTLSGGDGGGVVFEEKRRVAAPPHKFYAFTYSCKTFTGTHYVNDEGHLVLRLEELVSDTTDRQAATGGKMGPPKGGRPKFMVSPKERAEWRTREMPQGPQGPRLPPGALRGAKAHAAAEEHAEELPREMTIPNSEIFELDALPVPYCEKPAGMGAYRESQLPEEERQARDAAFDQARAYADWSRAHFQRLRPEEPG